MTQARASTLPATSVLARLAITVWMLLLAALGYALWKADAR